MLPPAGRKLAAARHVIKAVAGVDARELIIRLRRRRRLALSRQNSEKEETWYLAYLAGACVGARRRQLWPVRPARKLYARRAVSAAASAADGAVCASRRNRDARVEWRRAIGRNARAIVAREAALIYRWQQRASRKFRANGVASEARNLSILESVSPKYQMPAAAGAGLAGGMKSSCEKYLAFIANAPAAAMRAASIM